MIHMCNSEIQQNVIQTTIVVIQENEFENIICKMATILSSIYMLTSRPLYTEELVMVVLL